MKKTPFLLLPALLLSMAAGAQGIRRDPLRKPVVQRNATTLHKPVPRPASNPRATASPAPTVSKPSVNIKATQAKPGAGGHPPRNMKEFKTTPQYAERQASYATAFTGPRKDFRFGDGSVLHIGFQKSSDGGQSDHISPSKSTPVTQQSGDWKCATSSMTINASTTDFGVSDFQKQAANIYPGAIYTFDHLMDGSFLPQPGARNPIIISTDGYNITGDSWVQVDNPSAYTIRNGVATLFHRFSGGGGNGSTTMQLYESYNTADWTLKLNAGGSAWGASINNAFHTSDKSQHRFLTIDVTKTLFTINTCPPGNGFFTDPANETAAPNMLFISSVAYGIRILANLEVTFHSSEAAEDFNAKYSSGLYSANFDLNYLQNNSSIETKINAYIVGGPNKGIITLDRDKLIASLNAILAGATYQNAQPISYTLRDMAGDVVGSQSATDQFTYRSCVPAKNPPTLQSVIVNIGCGDDGKDNDTHYSYRLYNSSGELVAQKVNNSDNSRFEDRSMNNSDELSVSGKHAFDEFFTRGTFRIEIFPNGHDTWKISTLNLTLRFSDGKSYKINYSNLILSEQNKMKQVYFQGTANGLSVVN